MASKLGGGGSGGSSKIKAGSTSHVVCHCRKLSESSKRGGLPILDGGARDGNLPRRFFPQKHKTAIPKAIGEVLCLQVDSGDFPRQHPILEHMHACAPLLQNWPMDTASAREFRQNFGFDNAPRWDPQLELSLQTRRAMSDHPDSSIENLEKSIQTNSLNTLFICRGFHPRPKPPTTAFDPRAHACVQAFTTKLIHKFLVTL